MVLASRSDPPLPLARLRARDQLTEVRAAELRFTCDEAADAAAARGRRTGLALPDASVAALAARTEGWAAGLQLAALSLRGQDDVAAFVAAFTGSHRYVLDYLAEEVLERQGEQVRTFLLETSVLERLSGPLCDAVTGRAGSQARLEQVERAGLFLVPLDEVRGWWRYHHLFADLLRGRLQQEQPGRVPQLHRHAAAWCEEHGLADDAIRHALAAGEMTWAARLIEQHFDEFYFLRGEAATIQHWLSALPADLVRSRPRLLLAQALMAATGGQLEAVEPLLDAAERAPAGAIGRAVRAYRRPGRQQAGELPGADRAPSAAIWPSSAATPRQRRLRVAGPGRAPRGRVDAELTRTGLLAGAEWLRGRLAAAERAFGPRIAGWQEAGQPTMTAWGCYQLGQVQRAQGRLDAAVQTCQQALEITARPGRPPLPAAGRRMWAWPRWPTSGTSSTRAPAGHRGHRAVPPVRLHPAAGRRPGHAGVDPAGHGDPAGALEAIGEAGQAAPGPAGLLNPVPAQRARLLLAQGDLAAAARWTRENRPRRGRRAGLPPRAGTSGAGPGAAGPGPARPGAGAAGPAARGGGGPGPDRQPHRGRRAAGAGAGGQR